MNPVVSSTSTVQTQANGLTLTAYRGVGAVLLAIDLDPQQLTNLAGFAILRTTPTGEHQYLSNRLSFTTPITQAITAEQRVWTPSDVAPFQYFRWVDFPAIILPGTYTYTVTARYFSPGGTLMDGPGNSLEIDLTTPFFTNFDIAFTRGYLSSQAYADLFANAPIRPAGPKTMTYDTAPYATQYEWLGFRARKMIFDLLDETIRDPTLTLDALVYDLDEPDIINRLTQLGPRLRILADNASLHTKTGAVEPLAWQAFIQSAGSDHVKEGHFNRFAHCKIFIQKRNGQPVKVLTGSANFSVRGLYVQANNVLLFTDAGVATLYERMFSVAFANPSVAHFTADPISQQQFSVNVAGCPDCDVCFSPHSDPNVSLQPVADAITLATRSVFFAIMELNGTGVVMDALQQLPGRQVFSYGVTQSEGSDTLKVWRPGNSQALLVPFAFLKQNVPAPFRQEWSGGLGQVIHDKFVVVDFNGKNPVVFTGSSNLAQGGESANGDNLLAIRDRHIVTLYAVEALRLLDHYRFRSAMNQATATTPLQLQGPGAAIPWYTPFYDPGNLKSHDRQLFAQPLQ